MNNQCVRSEPRCYVLDEDFKVKLAARASASDPLNALYTSESAIDALPPPVEDAVRELTAGWLGAGAADCASGRVGSMIISVVPLHGPAGLHIGVFVEAAA